MLLYLQHYLLASVLLFQGLHLFQETEAPLGTVPEEVAQDPAPSQKWGAFLITWSVIALATGILSHSYDWFVSAIAPMRNVGFVILAVYAIWVVFSGRTVEFIGQPTLDDHHQGHASDHHGHIPEHGHA